MIDRHERIRTARIIAWAMRRRIDNERFDFMLSAHSSQDKAVRAIRKILLLSVDDAPPNEYVRVSPAGWKVLRRCIAFLQTDCETIGNDQYMVAESDIWPFPSRAAIFAARPKLERYKLPRYEPAFHHVESQWWNLRITWWNLPLVLVVIFGTPVLIVCLTR